MLPREELINQAPWHKYYPIRLCPENERIRFSFKRRRNRYISLFFSSSSAAEVPPRFCLCGGFADSKDFKPNKNKLNESVGGKRPAAGRGKIKNTEKSFGRRTDKSNRSEETNFMIFWLHTDTQLCCYVFSPHFPFAIDAPLRSMEAAGSAARRGGTRFYERP